MGYVNEQYVLAHFDEAIRAGHITAYFQPLYRAMTGGICGAEALARWEDPEKGLLSPAVFISVLEDHGLIYQLDMTILRCVCAAWLQLKALGAPTPPVSVNLSRLDFQEPDLFENFTGILRENGVPFDAVDVEITESVMLEDTAHFAHIVNRFREAGFRIWIDDFGSGYSSLNVLQNYEFHTLKIDMLFMQNANRKSRQMLHGIVSTAKRLGVHTLMEGVETEEQYQFLKNLGCEMIQGYYFSKPLRGDAYVKLIDGERDRVETADDRQYWEKIGMINMLSTNPLEEVHQPTYATVSCTGCQSDIPLALVEYRPKVPSADYVYANPAYLELLRDFGYQNVGSVEDYYNTGESPRFLMFKKLFDDALVRGNIQQMDYLANNVYSSFSAKLLARNGDKCMVVLTWRAIRSDDEEKKMDELFKYSQMMVTTFEHVAVFFPDRDAGERIYSKENFHKSYTVGSIEKNVRDFCFDQVWPPDQQRFLRLLDKEYLEKQLWKAEGHFFQQAFRIREGEDRFEWRSIRISHVPDAAETIYLVTMQRLSPFDMKMAEIIARELPDVLNAEA